MKSLLQSLKNLIFVFIVLPLSFSTLAQNIYEYIDNNSGSPFAVNSNMTGGSLARGGGLNSPSLTCTGSTDGFGSQNWHTGSVIATADANGKYVSFTISPNAGYRLNITGFTATLRSPAGPTSARYSYLIGANPFVQNGVSLTPGPSTTCSNVGVARPWASFTPIVTTSPVTFRIYGFNAPSAAAEMYLRSVIVTGTVECNPAITSSITPTSPSICVDNVVTLTGSTSGGTVPTLTHAWSLSSAGIASLSSPTTNVTNLITGVSAGTVSVQYAASYGSSPSCNVLSPSQTITVNPLPTITATLNPQVCRGTISTNLAYSAVSGSPTTYSLNFDATAQGQGFVDALNIAKTFGASGTIPITVPSGATAGNYNATLVVENTSTGCQSTVYNVVVTVNALPVVGITGNPSVCENGTIPLLGTSSPTAVTSSWLSSAPSFATVSSAGLVTGVAVGSTDITFTATDANGCTKTSAPFAMTVNPKPMGTLTFTETSGTTANDGTICSGDAVNFTATGGFTNYNFKIDGVSAQNSVSNTYAGTFTTNGTVAVEITNANVCMNTLAGVPITVGTCNVHNVTTNKYFVTIQAGINDASTVNGNTLEVASGTYNEQVLVNKELIIKGVGATKPIVNFTGTATGKLTLFDVSKPNVSIENFTLSVDVTKLGSAILGSDATLSALTVKDNSINPYRSSTGTISFGLRNAISINYGDYRISGNNPTGLLIQGNTVSYNTGVDATAGTSDDAGFRAGVSSDVGVGTFTGNTFQSISQDLELRFSNPGNLVVTNNNINGGGLEISEHNTASGTVTVSGNTFNGTFGNTYTNILRLKNNQTQKPTTVSGNTFTNTVWAASLENYRDVTFNNNTFTPLSGSTMYQHIAINTKLFSSGSATNVQTAIDGTFTNNTFNGSGATGGKALVFNNHDSDNAAYGIFTVGTVGNENNFNTGIQNFIFFDGSTGNSVAPITTMAPWNQNLDAQNNKFDVSGSLKLPSAMTYTERIALENKLVHKPDNSALGLIHYFDPVHNITQNTYFANIQPAIAAATSGDVIELSEFTYYEGITIDKPLTIQGLDSSLVILDGTSVGAANGITINNGISNVIIKKLKIRNFTGSGSTGSGIFGAGLTNNLMIDAVVLDNNQGRGGVYLSGNGGISDVTIKNSISKNNTVPGSRGIVIWDGLKQNITITGNKVYGNNCCGIELQDGNASGVTVTGNVVFSNIDNGIGLIGLTGPSANIVSGNIVTNNGRFGIEIKNPNGSGANSGAGSVVIDGNTVSRTIPIVDARDIAGIAVFRRGVTTGNADVPYGTVINGNTVSGYTQPSNSDGFGIVVEGINHTVSGNTVSGNDVGIQRQAGHTPYPADGDQSNLADTYFGRGNSPVTCGVTLTSNTLTNTINTRDVGNSSSLGIVVNTNTGKSFCTIQSAINDVATINGNTITVSAGTYNEQVLVNKEVKIVGVGATKPIVNFTGMPALASSKLTAFEVTVPNVTVDGLEFKIDISKIGSAIITAGTVNNLKIQNNNINPYRSSGTTLGSGLRNAVNINYGAFRINSTNPTGILAQNNIITYSAGVDNILGNGDDAGFRAGFAMDEGTGDFTGNTIQTISQDIELRFINTANNINITNNNINGGGVNFAAPNITGGTLTISGNTFNGAFSSGVANANLLRIRDNIAPNTINTIVQNNTFLNHVWGLSLENYGTVTVNNNTFTPLAASTTYHHLTVNTKENASSSATVLQTPIGGTFTNNTFNGSGTTGGTAMLFANHDNDNASFGTFTVGTSGNENIFNTGIANFIAFDGQTGSSNAATFPTYPSTPTTWTTTMACWNQDIDVINNKFDVGSGLQLPTAMNQANRVALENGLYHKKDLACLGKMCLPTYATLTSTSASVCAGSSTDLVATIVSATGPFTLIYTDGTTPVTVTGYVSGTNIPITPIATKTYSIVSITDAITCISTTGFTGTPTVTVNPLTGATSFTAGATTVCQDAVDETYTATAANSTSIVYSVLPSAAGVINSSTGVMNWDAAFSGTATITATATGLCGTTTADRIVTVNPKTGATTFTVGPITICQDAPDATYTATAANSTSIAYSVLPSAAGVINSSTGVMNWDAAFSGTATITATASGLCGTSFTDRVVTVNPLPTIYNVSGTGAICSGVASPILLSGSNTGVNYKLKTNTFTYFGSVLAGTGSGLSFTPPTSPTGTYFIEATNVTTGCISQMNGTVATVVATIPVLTVTSQTNVSCKDGSDGSVTVLASAGTGSYNYSFNGGTVQASSTFGGKTAGTYPIVANDITSGCIASINVTLTQPATLPSATVAPSGTACTGNTVTLTATATGGTAPYTYSWNGATATTSATLFVTATSSNTLVVTDSKGCIVPTVTTTVTFNTATPPTITGVSTVCSGSTISLSATGGGSYLWSGPNSFTSTIANVSITNATVSNSGTYIVTITDANSCMASSSVSVTVNPVPATPTPQANANIPVGGSITLTATGCSGTLKWYKSADNSPVTMPVSPTGPTNYYAKCEVTTNSVTCESAKSADVTVTVGDIVISIITGGAWNSPATWDVGRVPLLTDNVIIDVNHNVIVTDMNAVAKKLEYRTNSKVTFGNPATKLVIQGL